MRFFFFLPTLLVRTRSKITAQRRLSTLPRRHGKTGTFSPLRLPLGGGRLTRHPTARYRKGRGGGTSRQPSSKRSR